MNAEQRPPAVTDIALERYRLGELPPADLEPIRVMLAVDATLQARLASLDRDDEQFRSSGRPEGLARRALAIASAPRLDARLVPLRWLAPAAAAVVVAIVVIAVRTARPPIVPGGTDAAGEPAAAGNRVKGGGPALAVYRQTASGSETLADGSITRSGDVVRIGYRAADRAYGVILSIDGAGAVTVHLPARGEAAAALERGRTVLLDSAYELDDAPRFETFYFVTSQAPFDTAPVVAAARRTAVAVAAKGGAAAPLPLPRDLAQSTLVLQKEPRR